MNLLDYTTQTGFLPKLKCDNLTDAVSRLVATLVQAGKVTDPAGLVQEVMRREAEGSTAVGGGLVIPHARYSQVSSVHVAVGTLAEPLDLASDDGLPVDLVILLVGPTGDPRQMLRVLAHLARLVKHESYLQELRGCQTADALREAFGLSEHTGR